MTAVLLCLLLMGCGRAKPDTGLEGWERTELRYAERFTIDRDQLGRVLITINGTDRFLLLPEGGEDPEDGAAGPASGNSGTAKGGGTAKNGGTAKAGELPPEGVTVLQLPLSNLYAASSSVLDSFLCLDALDAVRFTSTRPADWSLTAVRRAMEDGALLYAGKYSAPDFEALLGGHCGLALENTMILHSPDIREQLEDLGIPVLIEWSSYESHPLGRMEWMKLYGLLLGREAEASAFFTAQAELVEQAAARQGTGKSAAFFSVSPSGSVTVRKPGDYVVKMIELAGGRYALGDTLEAGDSGLSSVNLQMEAFYAAARDADVLIYNGTIDGGMETLDQLLDKSGLLAEFRAVQTGDVWCTERNLFQEPTAAAGMILDFRSALEGTAEDRLTYLHRLK